MMRLIEGLRFLVEVVAILGLFSVSVIQISWLEKFLFFLLAVLLILFWARYMAPKSPHALKKWHRLVAETSIFILVSCIFWHLYGLQIGIFYLALSFGSLVLLYYFQLE
ncbi:DUF2568 domain-containing protein [Streptococcus infantis]|uniref:DUF2568 domain-containing protein n=2 Tax=Streptococcus peroris TaxID=68891 RepID=E8KAL8_9STRE|nr:hypothetical protein HMPREF9180_0523 [Streptococcus peroris ATCC 700780]